MEPGLEESRSDEWRCRGEEHAVRVKTHTDTKRRNLGGVELVGATPTDTFRVGERVPNRM